LIDWDKPLPQLRAVEAFPVDLDRGSMLAFKDPERYASAVLTVEQSAAFVMAACDGRMTLKDLAVSYKEKTGAEFPLESVKKLLLSFDEHYFFDNARFQKQKERVQRAWLASEIRPVTLFDYIDADNKEAATDDLRSMLNGIFQETDFEPGPEIRPNDNKAVALIAPHIDFLRGGRIWAVAYAEFAKSFQGRTVVILGTNHQRHQFPVAMTRKKFDTPFGVLGVDEEILEGIAERMPFDPFADELSHRTEHSIELAATMLAYMRPDLEIVPILLGGANDLIAGGGDQKTDEAMLELSSVCRDLLDSYGENIALIASADLAHVGKMFDDNFRIDDEKGRINKERDMAMLSGLVEGDPSAFVQYIAEEKGVRRICGLTPIYVAAEACGLPFELLAHDQWIDESGNGLVSYAALIARRD